MGYMLVTAVLVVTSAGSATCSAGSGSTTPGSRSSPSPRSLLSLDPFNGGGGRALADRLAGPAGRRRRDADGQLDGDPHRRVPGRPARHGARHQQVAAHGRLVHRPGRSAACSPSGTGARCSGSTSRSASSARSGRTVSCTTPAAPARARIDWWGNVTFAVGLTAVLAGITYGIQPYGGHTMGWTSPLRAGRPDRRRARAGRVRGRSRAASRSRCSTSALFRISAFTGRQRRRPAGLDRPRRPAVHADHLAAGDLAAAARLRLRVARRCGPASTCSR